MKSIHTKINKTSTNSRKNHTQLQIKKNINDYSILQEILNKIHF